MQSGYSYMALIHMARSPDQMTKPFALSLSKDFPLSESGSTSSPRTVFHVKVKPTLDDKEWF